ncbi:MAG: branched-chain amino acid ABC transporter permease [Planctomycetes bacterium]|nr:branched-chain amino acid ABC transporter permease [Planctomycetota bacterium]
MTTHGKHALGQAAQFILVILFFSLPWFGIGPYWLDVLNQVGLYAILALSLNIILGHAGMFHMGHAAFFAVGAYTTAILNTLYKWPIFVTMPLAGIAAGLFALVVAAPIIHLRGDYLLMVTIGIVEIVRIALINDIFGLTGGSNGIIGIARPVFFGFRITRPQHFFYLIWGFAALSMLMFHWLEHSRFGRALKYIKEDTIAAEGMGVNTDRYKLLAFAIGAVWAGFVGTIYASQMRTISPGSFNFWESVILFTIVILGGSGNQKGVLLGSFLVVGLPELFRGFQNYRMLFFGLALMVMMIFRPQGLIPPKPRRYTLPKPLADKYG